MISRAVQLASAALLAAVLVSACGSSSSTPSTTHPATTTIPPVISVGTMTISGKTITVPREEYTPDRPIQAVSDRGQQIIVTNDGVLPQLLIAPSPATITWTNLTASPVSITFAALGVKSKEIAPGGSWSYRTDSSVSLGYYTSTGYHGQVAVGLLPLPALPTTTSGR